MAQDNGKNTINWAEINGEGSIEQKTEAFLTDGIDTFAILQIRDTKETEGLFFLSLGELTRNGISPKLSHYDIIYTEPMPEVSDTDAYLESLFNRFNIDRPETFKGHSLSVSDIILLRKDGEITAHYTEPIGFKELPGFYKEKKKEKEDTIARNNLEKTLLRGSMFSGGKMRIFAMYRHESSASKRAAFLRDEYGQGGHSFTTLDGENGFVDYSGKGVDISPYHSEKNEHYTWRETEKALEGLIKDDLYLNENDKKEWAKLEEEYREVGGVPYPKPAFRMPTPEEVLAKRKEEEMRLPEYEVHFIDGHDLVFKAEKIRAKSKEDAPATLWRKYGDGYENFDHKIIEIREVKDQNTEALTA